jgi:hypothetical protein
MTPADIWNWFTNDPKGMLALIVALPVVVFFFLLLADVAFTAWQDRGRG